MLSAEQARLARETLELISAQTLTARELSAHDVLVWPIEEKEIPSEAPAETKILLSDLVDLSSSDPTFAVDLYLKRNGGLGYVLRSKPQLESDLHSIKDAIRSEGELGAEPVKSVTCGFAKTSANAAMVRVSWKPRSERR